MQRPVLITHPDLPGAVGTCMPSALHIWQDNGWVLYEPAPVVPEPAAPTFHEVAGQMVPDAPEVWVEAPDAPEWTASATSEQETDGVADDQETQS